MAFDPGKFFDYLHGGLLGPTLSQNEVDGCNAILGAMERLPRAYCAYGLATAFHETNATMEPVREAYWLTEAWRKRNLRYWPWYGRGYVQLTWEANYDHADQQLGLEGALIIDPDLALDRAIAAHVMRRGMEEGWFARDNRGPHNFARHLPEQGDASEAQYIAARRIINGTDKNKLVARHALQFQAALAAGGW